MSDNDNPRTVQPLKQHELAHLFVVARRLHAGRHAPVEDTSFESEIVDFPGEDFQAIAAAHARTCADTLPTDASADAFLDALAQVMAALATHIAFSDLVDDIELRQLYTAVVSDALADRNQHFIEWDEPESFPPALNQARTHGDQRPLQIWYREHHARQPDLRLFAVIIGAMTDGEEIKIKAVRSRASVIKRVLERHGYAVHAPCTGPPSGRDPEVVVSDDVDKIARADIVIALLDPAAHGVGILLGEAARSHPAVIFVAEACTDITPLAAIIGDPEPTRVTYITEASMATEVERALVERHDSILRRAAHRRRRASNSMETFDEYSQAYQFALDSGLTLEVPDHPDYRVRLICTSIESFRAATQSELEDICKALNDLLYGPDPFERPADQATPEPATQADPVDETPPKDEDNDDEDDDDFIFEWDQPSLFDEFTRHTEAARGELRPGWRKVNPLTKDELDFAETANEFLLLPEREFRRMMHEARVVRYREALAGSGVSRAHFGDAQAWVTFWRVHLGRP
jgi:hypothetical protein